MKMNLKQNILSIFFLCSIIFNNIAFGVDLNLAMSASHARGATPSAYQFRVYDQNKNPGPWIPVNDGNTVFKSYPENSVSAVEVSAANDIPYYAFLTGNGPSACHHFFPVGSSDQATLDGNTWFNIWGGYSGAQNKLNNIQFNSGDFNFILVSLGDAMCSGPNSDCMIFDCYAVKLDSKEKSAHEQNNAFLQERNRLENAKQ